jgi:hypothetical protein
LNLAAQYLGLGASEIDQPEEDETVIGYECVSCGHQQEHKGFHQCELCCGPVTEIYE